MVLPLGLLRDRLVELDAFRLDLLHEGRVVLHVETDVVEHAPSGRRLRRVGLGEPDLDARNVHDRRVVAGAGLAAEGLRVPGLSLGDFGFRHGTSGRARCGSASICVLSSRISMRTPSGVTTKAWSSRLLLPGSTGTPAAFHWATRSCTLLTMKPTWFTTEPCGAAIALLGPEVQIDVDAGEHHQRVSAGHEQLAAHGEEELLVGFHILRDDVPVTHGHADLVERGRLRDRACLRPASTRTIKLRTRLSSRMSSLLSTISPFGRR